MSSGSPRQRDQDAQDPGRATMMQKLPSTADSRLACSLRVHIDFAPASREQRCIASSVRRAEQGLFVDGSHQRRADARGTGSPTLRATSTRWAIEERDPAQPVLAESGAHRRRHHIITRSGQPVQRRVFGFFATTPSTRRTCSHARSVQPAAVRGSLAAITKDRTHFF